MKLLRTIVESNKEPTYKEVGWLDTRNNQYKLKFWRNDGWVDIYRDLHLNPDDYITKIDASKLYQPVGNYVIQNTLLNYYTKEETYSKNQVDTLIKDVASQADAKYATKEQIGDIEIILDNIIGG